MAHGPSPSQSKSEEHGRTQMCLEVARELADSEQIGVEHAILHRDVHRDPVGRQHLVSGSEIDRELLVSAELCSAEPSEHEERAAHGEIATEEDLARKEVVSDRKIVVLEPPLTLGKELHVAQFLEAREPALGASRLRLEKDIFRDVVPELDPVNRMRSKIFDIECAVVASELDVLRANSRHLYLAALDLRLDDARRGLVAVLRRIGPRRLIGGERLAVCGSLRGRTRVRDGLGRGAMMPEEVAHGGAAREARGGDQKKNAKPNFHSSTCSFWLRFVNTMWLRYSPLTKKRRVR